MRLAAQGPDDDFRGGAEQVLAPADVVIDVQALGPAGLVNRLEHSQDVGHPVRRPAAGRDRRSPGPLAFCPLHPGLYVLNRRIPGEYPVQIVTGNGDHPGVNEPQAVRAVQGDLADRGGLVALVAEGLEAEREYATAWYRGALAAGRAAGTEWAGLQVARARRQEAGRQRAGGQQGDGGPRPLHLGSRRR